MKILISGNYGAGNLGDEIILKGLINSLNKEYQNPEITVLSANPKETEKIHKVKAELMFPSGIRSFIKGIKKGDSSSKIALKNCDKFVIGGGGLFGGPESKGNFIWINQLLRAYFYKKPISIYGQSIGSNLNWIYKLLIKKIFNKAEKIIVRDKQSKIRLKKIGINKKILLKKDLAFKANIKNIYQKKEKNLTLALRQMKLNEKFKNEIAKIINKLIKENWTINIINFQKGANKDDKLAKEILEKIEEKEKINYIGSNYTIEEAIKLIGESYIVLAMRLHSIILSILTETEFLAINYNEKVEDFLKTEEKTKYLIKINELKLENSLIKKTFYL